MLPPSWRFRPLDDRAISTRPSTEQHPIEPKYAAGAWEASVGAASSAHTIRRAACGVVYPGLVARFALHGLYDSWYGMCGGAVADSVDNAISRRAGAARWFAFARTGKEIR
jgi:hypothetical protein